MATMGLYLPMDKQDLERPIPWKEKDAVWVKLLCKIHLTNLKGALNLMTLGMKV
jgi:hypothetical protein